MSTSLIVLALAGGYLLGSIPFGLLLTRAAGHGDVRKIGSGNIGATNVLRTGSKKLAAATVLLDALKGTAGVFVGWYLAQYLIAPTTIISGASVAGRTVISLETTHHAYVAGLLGGLGAFLGHVFPVWLGFKGGKGVATYIGVLIAAAWP
ncbi:MAG: glycerol-3-phosphate acyltransferase, partial [Hyphomicrobiaceae bacterium]